MCVRALCRLFVCSLPLKIIRDTTKVYSHWKYSEQANKTKKKKKAYVTHVFFINAHAVAVLLHHACVKRETRISTRVFYYVHAVALLLHHMRAQNAKRAYAHVFLLSSAVALLLHHMRAKRKNVCILFFQVKTTQE